jgi:hypothetical protein
MNTLVTVHESSIQEVSFTDDAFTARLSDGRLISIPIVWYPRLMHGSEDERERYELIGDGEGIHWPDLDEYVSVEGLLAGRRSGESHDSFKKWVDSRARN